MIPRTRSEPAAPRPQVSGLEGRERAVTGRGDRLIRWGAAVSVLLVTGIAAVISYGHAYELVTRYGESGQTARALPLTVDGLVATCSLVILYCTRHGRRAPRNAWALLITGVCATVGANVAHGLSYGLVGALVAGWPALVAVGTFELLIRLLRDAQQPQPHPTTLTDLGAADLPKPPDDADHQDDRELTDTPEPASAPGLPLEPRLLPLVIAAAERYAAELEGGQVPSIRRLKRELNLGQPKAKQIHLALAAHTHTRAAA